MAKYYRFYIEILDIEPVIWRRFLLAATTGLTFFDLHKAVQDAMGWEDSHLFDFRNPKGDLVAESSQADDGEGSVKEASCVKVASFYKKPGLRAFYTYDFGDSWEHAVQLEAMEERPERFSRLLLDGGRSCPPEDCGGPGGYDECCNVATGKKKDKEMKSWLGRWTPEGFDPAIWGKKHFNITKKAKETELWGPP